MLFKRDKGKISLIGIIGGSAIGLSLVLLIGAGLLMFPQTREYLGAHFEKGTLKPIDFYNLTKNSEDKGYLICPIDVCIDAPPDEFSPHYELPSSQLRTLLFEYIDSQGSISLQNLDMKTQKFDFIERTPSMRFPDIITVQLFELSADSSTLAIYSRSIEGYGDEARNKNRIKRWIEFISPN